MLRCSMITFNSGSKTGNDNFPNVTTKNYNNKKRSILIYKLGMKC